MEIFCTTIVVIVVYFNKNDQLQFEYLNFLFTYF